MKIKCRPEDFTVEELPTADPASQGNYVFYRLTKRGLGTLEAIEAIRRRWNLPGSRIQYGGLKDRHAATIQYLTILGGPDQPLHETSFELDPIGRLPHPYGPAHFRGNRFTLVLRDLTPHALTAAQAAAAQLAREGVPNYFDDQRFGSVGFGGAFIAEAWMRGNHEEAFRLAMAEPNPSDRPKNRREKEILRDCWGDWPRAKSLLDRSHARSLVTYLVDHPTDFKGAFARHDRSLRSLYFSAFQSALWNDWLAAWLIRETRPGQRTLLDFRVAQLPLVHDLDDPQIARLQSLVLPLPGARVPEPTGPDALLIQDILARRDLTWNDLRVRGLKDVFLSRGQRAGAFLPANLQASPMPDELYPRRHALTLSFELPKGAYATLVVKRLTEIAPRA